MKQRKCKVCKGPATMGNAVNAWCSEEHGRQLARDLQARAATRKARAEAKQRKDDRERVKTRAEVQAECQAAFNAWIRARDFHLPCISCGRPNDGHHQRHAGHYRSVGSTPALRFHPDNCHGQCATCNNYLSGNLTAYRINLVQRIGLERVEWLEGPHEAAKCPKEELKVMRANFRQLAKEALRGTQR